MSISLCMITKNEENYLEKCLNSVKELVDEIIEEINPDVICLGYDQDSFTNNLKEELNKRGISPKIIRVDAYKEDRYKSSKLK